MRSEDHLKKARRIEKSIRKLDPEEDWELVVEGAFGSALHYIAWITESEVGDHRETHRGLPHFLDKNDLSELAESFREIGLQRQRRWYGSKDDGKTSRKILSALDKIKERVKE